MQPDINDRRWDVPLDVLYGEAASIARYFWDWRYKLLTYSLTLNTALFTAAGWIYVHAAEDNKPFALAPLVGGALTSALLMIMDFRNGKLLDMAYEVAEPIERVWLGGDEDDERGFYSRIQSDVDSHGHRTGSFVRDWTWHSSYTVILRWWFSLAFIAYCAAIVGLSERLLDGHRASRIAVGLVAAILLAAALIAVAWRKRQLRSE